MKNSRRNIPAVEAVVQALQFQAVPRPLVVAEVRRQLEQFRKSGRVPDTETVLSQVRAALLTLLSSRLKKVINGTGVILHTNLGRAPLSAKSLQELVSVSEGYCNLELDLVTGQRGHRGRYVEKLLAHLCGAQDALVVNNCAAALILILRHFVRKKREVIISRGELVQIGGGFRIPDILLESGAALKEVGTTNKTSLIDYAKAIGKETALILKVHRSNFAMEGFVEAASTEELAQLSRKKRIPFVEDLGSGVVIHTKSVLSLDYEPTPAEVYKKGAELVCFSGDKLLGGPQAGIVIGRAKRIDALRKEPLLRALRADKMAFAALQATAETYLAGSNEALKVPVLQQLSTPVEQLEERANQFVKSMGVLACTAKVVQTMAEAGGGTLPKSKIESRALAIAPTKMSVSDLAKELRLGDPAIVGYVSAGLLRLDLRTILPGEDTALLARLKSLLA